MAKYTHDAIMSTFTEMIGEMSFDQITVSELVKRCNISPNTFYYHYKDKYELLNAWFSEGLRKFSEENDGILNWKEIMKRVLKLCRDNDTATYHIYNSLSRDALERFAFNQSEDLVMIGLAQMAKDNGVEISEKRLEPIANTAKFMLLGFFLHFIWNKMVDDIDEEVETIGSMVEDFIAIELAKASFS